MSVVITETIQSNMNIVLNTIRSIMNKDGDFEFDDLRQSGLSRVDVKQAIALLNASGYTIIKMRDQASYWQWQNVYWARREPNKGKGAW